MIEITLLSNSKKIFTRISGETVVFEKERTKYFSDDDEIANRIKSLSEDELVGVFEVNEDIKQYPLPEGWQNFSPTRLKEILETLGKDTSNIKRQPPLVAKVEEAIEDGLIVVRKDSDGADMDTNPDIAALQQENAELKKDLHGFKIKHGKATKAFEETVAELLERIEKLEDSTEEPVEDNGNSKKGKDKE